MPTVRVTVPAVALGFGTGADAIGLAIGLHSTLELITRPDALLTVTTQGEGDYPANAQHPALRAADALFKKAGHIPGGLTLNVKAGIPANAGLGDVTALIVGGLVGANNLLPSPFKREQMAELCAEVCREMDVPAAAAITSLFGGLTITSASLIYRRVDAPAQKLVLALPDVPGFAEKAANLSQPADAARTALLIEGFRKNDIKLIEQLMSYAEDPRIALIPGYAAASEAARKAGAFGVTLCNGGLAILAFAQVNHKLIETELQKAFDANGVKVRLWQVNMDTQGVAISVSG
jgi:homoserine kinase